MKKIIFLTAMVFMSVNVAQAHIDSEHLSTPQYMLNAGYSSDMARFAELITRDPYAPTDDKFPQKSPARFFKLLWKKIDSTAFPDDNNTWHDIKMNTGFSDLN